MGVDFADVDRDGHDDFFVGDMWSRLHELRMRQNGGTNPPISEIGEVWDRNQIRANVLNINRGDNTYANLASFAGVAASDWTWSVAFLDVDLDGFEDLLVVAQNAGATRLLKNNSGKTGLRVRLAGTPGNPDGIGAVVALRFGAKSGPAREIHGGSGYWSQDSVVPVLSTPQTPAEVIVRWPGGKQTTSAVPAGAKEIVVSPDGSLKQVK